jgi:hypothetical protein
MEQAIEEVGEYKRATRDNDFRLDVFVKCDECEGRGHHVTYDGPERSEDVECDYCNGSSHQAIYLSGREALLIAIETSTTTIAAELRAYGLIAYASEYEAASDAEKPMVAERIQYVLEAIDAVEKRNKNQLFATEPLFELIASVANKTQMKGAA